MDQRVVSFHLRSKEFLSAEVTSVNETLEYRAARFGCSAADLVSARKFAEATSLLPLSENALSRTLSFTEDPVEADLLWPKLLGLLPPAVERVERKILGSNAQAAHSNTVLHTHSTSHSLSNCEPGVVAVCIPYFRGSTYIRRAVESILQQTYKRLQVVIINDGDTSSRIEESLVGLDDDRVFCFSLLRNHGGPYFAIEVLSMATTAEWILIQEQDDWSEGDRIETLVRQAGLTGADVVVSGQTFFLQEDSRELRVLGGRFLNTGWAECPNCGPKANCQKCYVDLGLTSRYRYRAPHAGLFRNSILRMVGGYYNGMNLHFDTLLMNLLLMVARVVHVSQPLYNRVLQPNSLTHAAATGFGSAVSNHEREVGARVYASVYPAYQQFLRGAMDSENLIAMITKHTVGLLDPPQHAELKSEADRLSRHFRSL